MSKSNVKGIIAILLFIRSTQLYGYAEGSVYFAIGLGILAVIGYAVKPAPAGNKIRKGNDE